VKFAPGVDFTNVYRPHFSRANQNVTRKNVRMKNATKKPARKNVGEIDPWRQSYIKVLWSIFLMSQAWIVKKVNMQQLFYLVLD